MLMKLKGLCIILGCVTIASCAQSKKEIIPSSYTAYKTTASIVVDGKPDDKAWDAVAWSADFIDIEGDKAPKYKTQVKMLWDDEYYYILAKMEEPHVWGNLKQKDTIIFYNNDFEIFVDPDGDGHTYYEMEINALNTVWDLYVTKPYRELKSPVLNDWNATGLKSAITVNGTLNNAADVDKEWIMEIAIPFKVFRESYFHDVVPKDKFWRINFSRVNWDHDVINGKYYRKKGKDGKFLREYNWVWSPIGVINIHLPEKWGYVYFSSKQSGETTYEIPKEEQIKWKLFEMYRAQKTNYSKHKKWITSISSLASKPLVIDSKTIKFNLDNHKTGWNISAKSPFSGKELIITEDGKLITTD